MLRIMPRQKVFFDCFEQCVQASVEAAALLQQMLAAPDDYASFVPKIEACEERGDRAAAQVAETLSKNLTTPFDRGDIGALMETLDDVLDGIDTVAHKLVIYRAQKVRVEATGIAAILGALCPALQKAVA